MVYQARESHCPFCCELLRPPEDSCPICRHALRPTWLDLPPHKYSAEIRLELVLADCDYIARWKSALAANLLVREGLAPFLRRQIAKGRHDMENAVKTARRLRPGSADLGPDPESSAVALIRKEFGICDGGLARELVLGNHWREQVKCLSGRGAAAWETDVFQTDLVSRTYWSVYGSPENRTKVLLAIRARSRFCIDSFGDRHLRPGPADN